MCAKVKIYLTEIAASQLNLNGNEKEDWVNNINLFEMYKLLDVKGISMLYAKKCQENGLYKLRDIMLAAQTETHVMHAKAKLASKWIEEKLVFIPSKVNLFARCEDQIVWITDGANNLKITKDTPSKEIRQAIDSLLHKTCKMYDPSSKYPNITLNRDRLQISFGNISKITSIRSRNANLRAIHGDIYTYERMKRYNMVDNDSCPRCGEVETREHLILSCPQSKKIWQYVFDLINKVHQQKIELSLQSVLNLNHISDSKPITNIIAHFLHNIIYFRPTDMTYGEIDKRIYDLVSFEIKGAEHKPKKNCQWHKWKAHFLTQNAGRTL
jgi:NAD-dependent SIR2 family protein deacetylase